MPRYESNAGRITALRGRAKTPGAFFCSEKRVFERKNLPLSASRLGLSYDPKLIEEALVAFDEDNSGRLQRPTTGRDLQFRWFLRVGETVSGFGRWRVFWKATDRAPSFELSIVRIGLKTTELRVENELQIAACGWG